MLDSVRFMTGRGGGRAALGGGLVVVSVFAVAGACAAPRLLPAVAVVSEVDMSLNLTLQL